MNKEEVKGLLKKYQEDRCSAKEKAAVESWYNMQVAKNSTAKITDDLDEAKRLIWDNLPKDVPAQKSSSFIYKRVAVAAAVLIVIGALAVILNLVQDPNAKVSGVMLSLSKYDITPGTNKATLTLANGKTINLSDAKTGIVIDAAKLTYSDGSEVRVSSKTESLGPQSGQSLRGFSGDPLTSAKNSLISAKKELTVSTPKGGQYEVILPDGTKVTLNAGSSLKFPATFANLKERKVKLNGEAYFIVKHNAKQPFRIQTAGQIVEDIGTEFNINAYADENGIKTTLIEGSARVIVLNPLAVTPLAVTLSLSKGVLRQAQHDKGQAQHDKDVVLIPGQQSTVTDQNIKLSYVNVEEATAWKNGYFRFNNEDIQSVMRKLSRWYNIEVQYEGQISTEGFNGKISRFKNISEVLNALESTKTIHFKVKGRRITVIN